MCSTRMRVHFLTQREILCNLSFSVLPLRFARFSRAVHTSLQFLHAIARRNEDTIGRGPDVVGAGGDQGAVPFDLYAQLLLGLLTIPFSAAHLDGSMMLVLSDWAQRIVTFRPGAAELIASVPWVYKAHLFLGLTVFLVFPFTRLVHIWSAPVWYLGRRYQIVRKRLA